MKDFYQFLILKYIRISDLGQLNWIQKLYFMLYCCFSNMDWTVLKKTPSEKQKVLGALLWKWTTNIFQSPFFSWVKFLPKKETVQAINMETFSTKVWWRTSCFNVHFLSVGLQAKEMVSCFSHNTERRGQQNLGKK